MSNDVVIAKDLSNLTPLESHLNNLRLRLKLQMEWVSKTEAEIELIENMIKEGKTEL